ncbi:MAG: response regulator [Proteobacteria bacterium]|nr:response regulator [Pseudomonadota bacterium]
MLEVLGLTVHTAVNGLEALEMVRQQNIDFRAVVMDISMPIMNGIDAMKEMRKCNADLPILLNSGYAEEDFAFDVEGAAKPDVFLKKPFQFAELQRSLEKLLP